MHFHTTVTLFLSVAPSALAATIRISSQPHIVSRQHNAQRSTSFNKRNALTKALSIIADTNIHSGSDTVEWKFFQTPYSVPVGNRNDPVRTESRKIQDVNKPSFPPIVHLNLFGQSCTYYTNNIGAGNLACREGSEVKDYTCRNDPTYYGLPLGRLLSLEGDNSGATDRQPVYSCEW